MLTYPVGLGAYIYVHPNLMYTSSEGTGKSVHASLNLLAQECDQ